MDSYDNIVEDSSSSSESVKQVFGPKFVEVSDPVKIYDRNKSKEYKPFLMVTPEKGFSRPEDVGYWVAYRRNFFQIRATAAIKCLDEDEDNEANDSFFVEDEGSLRELTKCYISLQAISDEDGENIPLVQMTAKRHRGPQFRPLPVPVRPYMINSTMDPEKKSMFHRGQMLADGLFHDATHTFDRTLFKHSTSPTPRNDGTLQTYRLMVDFLADYNSTIFGTKTIKLTSVLSEPMIVRGRNPRFYGGVGSNNNACRERRTYRYTPAAVMQSVPLAEIPHETVEMMRNMQRENDFMFLMNDQTHYEPINEQPSNLAHVLGLMVNNPVQAPVTIDNIMEHIPMPTQNTNQQQFTSVNNNENYLFSGFSDAESRKTNSVDEIQWLLSSYNNNNWTQSNAM